MTRVAPVKLKNNHRTLWFDPNGIEASKDDAVVVSTARGTELGVMADDVMEVAYEVVKKLKTPLKPVLRKATEEDLQRAEEMERLSAEALPIFKEMAAEANEGMHPISVEYLLDGERAVFYFESEDRVDFRELVRKLASRFRVRVDMRQIGVRDEARMVGGLGHCGQELCCKRLGGEFCPVSIRMAKEQDLSLNPQKISGVCGRLMCCLRYEFDAYKEFKGRAPKKNAAIETPAGEAKVVDLDVPREVVSLKTEDGQVVKVPLASFEPAAEGARPHAVGEQAWEEANAPAALSPSVSSLMATQSLSGQDKLAEPGAVRRTGGKAAGSKQRKGKAAQEQPAETRKPRRRTKASGAAQQDVAAKGQKKRSQGGKGQEQRPQGGGKPKKRQDRPTQQASPDGKKGQQQKQQKQGSVRPGRKSSALRQQQPHGSDAAKRPAREAGSEGAGRRSRRRSHKAHGSSDGASAEGSGSSRG